MRRASRGVPVQARSLTPKYHRRLDSVTNPLWAPGAVDTGESTLLPLAFQIQSS